MCGLYNDAIFLLASKFQRYAGSVLGNHAHFEMKVGVL